MTATLPEHAAEAPDLDATATLAAAEQVVAARRAAVVADLELVLHWADLHSTDPQAEPGAVPARFGGNKLVRLGGDGTPLVQDLCVAELAVARQASPAATRAVLGDALDLRHRLPATWAVVRDGGCEPWVALRVARLSRDLDAEAVGVVDVAVAEAIGGQCPSRVLAIAEAKIIEADTAAATERLEAGRRRRGVWTGRTDLETGNRSLFARLDPGDVTWLAARIEQIADALAVHPEVLRAHHPDTPADLDDLTDDLTCDELRAIAMGWLARPDDVLRLLGLPADDGADQTARVARVPHHRAVVYLHLHESALTALSTAPARVEGLGPMLLEQVVALLGHAHVTIKPVIDLEDHVSVNAYEFPTPVTERTRLRCIGDVFPYATSTATMTGRYDDDHPTPYEPGGPPGQTGDHNNAPLTRSHHRAKTHLGYRVKQVGDATYLWTTPHGLRRLVDPRGTHRVDDLDAHRLENAETLDAAIRRLHTEMG